MDLKQQELVKLVFIKMSEFQNNYKQEPDNIVLPFFLKDLVLSLHKSGKFVFMDNSKIKIIGLTINWSKSDSLKVIQCF